MSKDLNNSTPQQLNASPLTIGNRLPGISLSNIINYKNPSVNLSAFNGKLLIIDFWEAWCTSCIRALPRLDSLNKAFRDRVQVLTITSSGTAASIRAELKRFKTTRNLSLPIAVGDTIMHTYFPNQLVSHVVWIDPNGIVRAITGADYVTAANINQLLSGKPLHWPVKIDALGFNYNAPALGLTNTTAAPSGIWYSALSPYRPGLNSTTAVVDDSAAQIQVTNYYNLSLLQLATLSLYNATALPNPKKLRLYVTDTSKYIFTSSKDFYQPWQQQNAWCFSSVLPLSLSKQQRQKFISAQLAAWLQSLFGLTAALEKHPVPCWVLTFNGDTANLKTAGAPPSQDWESSVKSITNRPITELVAWLNEKVPGIPWVLNQTGLPRSKKMDLQLNIASFTDLDTLRAALQPYGFNLTPATRELEFVVIRENNQQPLTPPRNHQP